MDVANAARHDDYLARVNPIIVERYLTRVANGKLLLCDKAPVGDDGFFYLSVPPSGHGWELPATLGSDGTALVSTRADARRKAIDDDDHSRAAEAVMLGPSDPALTALAEGLRERVAAEMWQGAVLADRTQLESYSLFVYECDIIEGSQTHAARQRQRKSTISSMIRVLPSGEARCVSWDTLPNLVSDPSLDPVALSSADAQAAYLAAQEAAEAERSRRAEQHDSWVEQLKKQLRRLPNALTDPIIDREARLAQKRKIEATIARRIAEAEGAARVTCGEPRRIGWVRVVAVRDDDASAEEVDTDSEAVSMRLVMQRLLANGWTVRDVHTDGHGYDLHAERGAEQRCVEVKGRAGKASQGGIILTGGELAKAQQLGEEYWLYVVENCIDGEGRLYGAWQNPAVTFRESFIDVPVVRLAGSELKAALGRQGESA